MAKRIDPRVLTVARAICEAPDPQDETYIPAHWPPKNREDKQWFLDVAEYVVEELDRNKSRISLMPLITNSAGNRVPDLDKISPRPKWRQKGGRVQ